MTDTAIEWTDKVWNPIAGCSVLSPGCTNCYAMRMAARIQRMGGRAAAKYAGTTMDSKVGPVWTGKINFDTETLRAPFGWKKPARVFVNSMADLFHDDVTDEQIDQIFAVMALCHQHTFQVLTKRADRMRRYFAGIPDLPNAPEARDALIEGMAQKLWQERTGADPSMWLAVHMPLPNVWLGVSAEDQQRADERIPHLLATPAAVRWVSAEPLLGPLDLTAIKQTVAPGFFGDCLQWYHRGKVHEDMGIDYPRLNWIVAGGESGPHARPCHPDWLRSLRDQCGSAGVPFFFKQWGEWAPEAALPPEHGIDIDDLPYGEFHANVDWVDSCLCAEGDPGSQLFRVRKKAAGATLDGREHREWPK